MQLELGESTPILTVSALNREARRLLEQGLGFVRVEAEISNLSRPASGHIYFTLKDGNAQVRCAMFRQSNRRLSFRPEDGSQVLVSGRVSLYEVRGDYQLIVDAMEEAGEGLLRRRFEALKLKLTDEGLFDPAHKRPLPTIPSRIGVVTSPTGAAVRDVLTGLRRRFPAIPVLIYPTQVQGASAAVEIVNALRTAERRAECDVLILTRGGGSLEDLWPFNEEVVARAIAGLGIPVVAGVGHEVDFSIADFVADVRAPTPSQAAELCVPVQTQLAARLAELGIRATRCVERTLAETRRRLETGEQRLGRVHPRVLIEMRQQRLDDVEKRLARALREHRAGSLSRLESVRSRLGATNPKHRIREARDQIERQNSRLTLAIRKRLERVATATALAERSLRALSPLATLERGFAIVTRSADGRLVTSTDAAPVDTRLEIRVADGRLAAQVIKPDT